MSDQPAELRTKAQALRNAIEGALNALTVAMIAAEELVDALDDKRNTPATDVERRQVAALRKLLMQPTIDGVAMTHGQVEHEIAQWTAEAERRLATGDQIREINELVAGLALDGVAAPLTLAGLTLAGYVREKRRLKALIAQKAPAAAK